MAAATGWIYELLVWVRLLHLTGPYGIAENTAVLSFGPEIRSLGAGAFTLGVCIHCLTAVVWGILFALIWPALRARSIEATLAVLLSPAPPTYTVDSVLNGLLAHSFAFSVPMALVIKRLLGQPTRQVNLSSRSS